MKIIYLLLLLVGCYRAPHIEYPIDKFDINQKYISVIEGNMPVLLVVSHSGEITFTDVLVRKDDDKFCNYNINNDLYTNEIAFKLSDILYKKYNKKPYIIINHIHRKYLDLNRSINCSYEDDRLEQIYNEFHIKMKDLITNIKSNYGDGLLIDIHGQISYDGDVFIGVLDDRTLNSSLNGEYISNLFSDKGYTSPPNSHWRGGFIVDKYGIKEGYRNHSPQSLSWKLNAFQIEIDKKYRYTDNYDEKAVRYRFCWDFADIVMDVLKKIEIN